MKDAIDVARLIFGYTCYTYSDIWHKLGVKPLANFYDDLGNRSMG